MEPTTPAGGGAGGGGGGGVGDTGVGPVLPLPHDESVPTPTAQNARTTAMPGNLLLITGDRGSRLSPDRQPWSRAACFRSSACRSPGYQARAGCTRASCSLPCGLRRHCHHRSLPPSELHRTGRSKFERESAALQSTRGESGTSRFRAPEPKEGDGVAPAWNVWYLRFELQALRGDTQFEELIAPRT